MLDLMVDFGDGIVKPLLNLSAAEFAVIQNLVAQRCLVINHDGGAQDVAARIEIERVIRRTK